MKTYAGYFLLSSWFFSAQSYANNWQKSVDAIASMQGCYEVSFEFQETESLRDDYQVRETPYRAEALEYIHFSRQGDRLILQNVMKLPGGMYLKHWRQVWEYEADWHYNFLGGNIWEKDFSSSAQGQWLQRVYQVDDSPRYECSANWSHTEQGSSWGCQTWAPLPRREYSQRSDYHILSRGNTHLITNTGWEHIQDNTKVILSPYEREAILSGQTEALDLVREAGLNRYIRVDPERCSDVKFWWEKQEQLWKVVQGVWDEVYEANDLLELKDSVNGRRLWQALFGLVRRYEALHPLSPEQAERLAGESRRVIAQYVTD